MENKPDIQEISEHIIEKILPNYFRFTLKTSETDESGNVTKLYSELAEKLNFELTSYLEKELL